eukprot:1851466-Amphidinium_carterae.1
MTESTDAAVCQDSVRQDQMFFPLLIAPCGAHATPFDCLGNQPHDFHYQEDKDWAKAAKKEVDSLTRETPCVKIETLPARAIFVRKCGGNLKCKMVACGNFSNPTGDYLSTFDLHGDMIGMAMADVETAFLNGELSPNSRHTLLILPPKAIVTLLGLDSDWVWCNVESMDLGSPSHLGSNPKQCS